MDTNEKECNKCLFCDEVTGSCTNDSEECIDKSAFVQRICPEDIFKILFMMIYNTGGQIEIKARELEDFKDDYVFEQPIYDIENKVFIIRTKPQPPDENDPTVILVPAKYLKKQRKRKIIKPNKRLILPNMNKN